MSALNGVYSSVIVFYDITRQKSNESNKYLCYVCDLTSSNCCGFVVLSVLG